MRLSGTVFAGGEPGKATDNWFYEVTYYRSTDGIDGLLADFTIIVLLDGTALKPDKEKK